MRPEPFGWGSNTLHHRSNMSRSLSSPPPLPPLSSPPSPHFSTLHFPFSPLFSRFPSILPFLFSTVPSPPSYPIVLLYLFLFTLLTHLNSTPPLLSSLLLYLLSSLLSSFLSSPLFSPPLHPVIFTRLCEMHLETESDGELDFLPAFAYNPGSFYNPGEVSPRA